jgi:hypothetical protein
MAVACDCLHAAEQFESLERKRQDVWLSHLHARGRNAPNGFSPINLISDGANGFAGAAHCPRHEPERGSCLVVAFVARDGMEKLANLCGCKWALVLCLVCWRAERDELILLRRVPRARWRWRDRRSPTMGVWPQRDAEAILLRGKLKQIEQPRRRDALNCERAYVRHDVDDSRS